MERSFAAAALLAERLDRMTLGTGRPVGLAQARQALAEAAGESDSGRLRPQQAGDVLDLAQDRHRDRRGALGAVAQHRVDMAGIGHQPAHLAADPAEHLDREPRTMPP